MYRYQLQVHQELLNLDEKKIMQSVQASVRVQCREISSMGVLQTKLCAAEVERETTYSAVVRVVGGRDISDVMIVLEQCSSSISISIAECLPWFVVLNCLSISHGKRFGIFWPHSLFVDLSSLIHILILSHWKD